MVRASLVRDASIGGLAAALFFLSLFLVLRTPGPSPTGFVSYVEVPLSFNVTSPLSQEYSGVDANPFNLTVEVSKPATVTYALDGGAVQQCCASCFECSAYLGDLAEGSHEVEVVVSDHFSAIDSETVDFDVALRPDLSVLAGRDRPYLYFTESDIPGLQQRWVDEDAELDDYPVYQLRDWIRFEANLAYPEMYFNNSLYEEVSKATDARANAFICLMEGNAQGPDCPYDSCGYCDLAKEALLAANDSRQSGYYSWYGRWDENFDTLIKYAITYDMMYDLLTPEERADVERRIATRAAATYSALSAVQGNPSTGGAGLDVSTRTMGASALGFVALAMPDYHADTLSFCKWIYTNESTNESYCWGDENKGVYSDVSAQDWMDYAVDVLFGVDEFNSDYDYWTAYARGSGFSTDGVGNFGGPYDRYQHREFDRFAVAWYNSLGGGPLVDLPQYYDTTVDLYLPDNDILNFDAGFADRYLWTQQAPYAIYASSSAAEAKYHLYHWKQAFEDFTSDWTVRPTAYSSLFSYIMFDDQVKSWYDDTSRDDLDPTSNIYPDGGFAVLRNGSGSNDTMIVVIADHKFSELNGEETKQGEFILFSRGIYLVPHLGSFRGTANEDAGTMPVGFLLGDPFEDSGNPITESMFHWGQSHAARNVVLVDGRGADAPDAWPKGDPAYFTSWFEGDVLDSVSLSYTMSGSYLGSPVDVDRSVLFVDDYAVIVDVLSSNASHTYSFQLNLGEDDTGNLSLAGDEASWEFGGAAVDVVFASPVDGLSGYETIAADGTSYGGCINYHSCVPTEVLRADRDGDKVTFLTVVDPRDATAASTDYQRLSTSGGSALDFSGAVFGAREGAGPLVFPDGETDASFFWSKDGSHFVADASSYRSGSVSFSSNRSVSAMLDVGMVIDMMVDVSLPVMLNVSTLPLGSAVVVSLDGSELDPSLYVQSGSSVLVFLERPGWRHVVLTPTDGVDFPPSVSLVAPADGNVSSSSDKVFSCSASDDSLLQRIFFFVDVSGDLSLVDELAVSGTSATAGFSLSNLSPGTFEWGCVAQDNASQNSSLRTRSFTVLAPPNDNPVISLLSPLNGSFVSRPVNLSCSVSDGDGNMLGASLFADGAVLASVADNVSSYLSAEFAPSPGSFAWGCNASDSLGGSASRSRSLVVVEYSPPVMTGFDGETTNFSGVFDFDDVPVVLEDSVDGVVNFSNVSSVSGVDFSAAVVIDDLSISVDVSSYPQLDVPATLRFYDVDFEEPVVLRDGEDCGSVCSNEGFAGGVFSVDVEHFSEYEVVEGAEEVVPVDPPSSGGRGGGGSYVPPVMVEENVSENVSVVVEPVVEEVVVENVSENLSAVPEAVLPEAEFVEPVVEAPAEVVEDDDDGRDRGWYLLPVGFILIVILLVLFFMLRSERDQRTGSHARRHVKKAASFASLSPLSLEGNPVPAVYRTHQPFVLANGNPVHSLQELIEVLPLMGAEEFGHFVSDEKHDFSVWIRDVFDDEALAQEVGAIRDPQVMADRLIHAVERREFFHAQRP